MSAETVICKLRETRTDLGFTQRQVANGADMNVRTLINIENGHTIQVSSMPRAWQIS